MKKYQKNINRKIIGIIPARMAASRFPGKPLKKICGTEMLSHVYFRAKMCKNLSDVYVATCDFDTECPFVVPLVFEIFDMMI